MKAQDKSSLLNAIKDAIDVLEFKAHTNGYQTAPEHTNLVAYLKKYQTQLKRE